jgi:hypothetical protein
MTTHIQAVFGFAFTELATWSRSIHVSMPTFQLPLHCMLEVVAMAPFVLMLTRRSTTAFPVTQIAPCHHGTLCWGKSITFSFLEEVKALLETSH